MGAKVRNRRIQKEEDLTRNRMLQNRNMGKWRKEKGTSRGKSEENSKKDIELVFHQLSKIIVLMCLNKKVFYQYCVLRLSEYFVSFVKL